jgi:hypothetical protein
VDVLCALSLADGMFGKNHGPRAGASLLSAAPCVVGFHPLMAIREGSKCRVTVVLKRMAAADYCIVFGRQAAQFTVRWDVPYSDIVHTSRIFSPEPDYPAFIGAPAYWCFADNRGS